MSSQVSPREVIYTGIWTDWTRGRVQGLTLTVPSSHGSILIAFLAIFVKLAGGHLWDIFCYVVFHVLRSLSLLCSAVIYFLAISAAGLFSSKVVSTASNVLISGPSCGQIWQECMDSPVNSAQNQTYFTEQSELVAWAYRARQPQPNCQAYGRQLIPCAEWALLGSPGGNSFVPLPELNRTDGDVILIFIANNDLYFADAVNDPVFKANIPIPEVIPAAINNNGSYQNVTLTYFTTPKPVSVVGCARQYQWCNPAPSNSIGLNCTKMEGGHRLNNGLLGLNPRQEAVQQRIYWDTDFSRMEEIPGIGDDAISFGATYSATQVLAPLPDDQWIRELDRWFGMILTNIQLQTVQYATGQGVTWEDQARATPTSPDAEWMCASQMVQRNDYASFSMLGIILILSLGFLFITGNAILDPIVTHFKSKKKGHNTAIASAWRRNHVLQLQSMLYDSLGLAVWNRDALVPTKTSRESFGLPDVEKHGDVVKLDDLSSRTASRMEQDEPWPLRDGTSREKNASNVEGEYLLDVPMSDPINWPA